MLTLMTTIKATPFKIDFQKEMNPSNLAKKEPKLFSNPTPHCCPRQNASSSLKSGEQLCLPSNVAAF
jgi:hypothetical protein